MAILISVGSGALNVEDLVGVGLGEREANGPILEDRLRGGDPRDAVPELLSGRALSHSSASHINELYCSERQPQSLEESIFSGETYSKLIEHLTLYESNIGNFAQLF